MVETEGDFEELDADKTILEAIKDERVFSVKKQPDGRFRVREECDKYYAVYLTTGQLTQLADDLKALADT
jgi:hypothetical protein